MNEDTRSKIFADFRDLIDGYMDKKFGNGVHKTFTDIHSSVLFASTNAIEKFYSLHSHLGQRILFMRPRSDAKKAMEQVGKNAEKVDEMREELHESVLGYTIEAVKAIQKAGLPILHEDQREDMGKAYGFLAQAWTNISHDYGGVIDEIPEPEFPTRIAKTVNRLIQVHAFIYGRSEVGSDDLAFWPRILCDNVPTRRLLVLRSLDEKGKDKTQIMNETRLPMKAVTQMLTDLTVLGVVENVYGKKAKTYIYKVSSEVVDILDSITGITPAFSTWD